MQYNSEKIVSQLGLLDFSDLLLHGNFFFFVSIHV